MWGATLLPGRVAPLKRQTVVDLLIRSKLYKVGTFLLMRLHLLLLSLFPALTVDKYFFKKWFSIISITTSFSLLISGMFYANKHLIYLIFTVSLVKRGKYICSKNLQLAFDIIWKGYYLQVQVAYPCYGQFSWIRLLVCKYSWIRECFSSASAKILHLNCQNRKYFSDTVG